MLKTNEINIRDPFVLVWEGCYYMYGTRAATCWGKADGFDCYRSANLKEWEGPFEVFHRPQGFWADKNYWAPEVHLYKGSFYMFATFASEASDKRGTMILKSDQPLGPFTLHSEGVITPDNWKCLDGTFYLSPEGQPFMVFCHEWQDISNGDGTICSIPLTEDLTKPAGEAQVLFSASQAVPWVKSFSHPRYPRNNYVTDGPFLFRLPSGRLIMLWSSFGESGYAQATASSQNGCITGPWIINKKLLFEKDGGHGMLFTALNGQLFLVLHSPNTSLKEHPVFYPIDISLLEA